MKKMWKPYFALMVIVSLLSLLISPYWHPYATFIHTGLGLIDIFIAFFLYLTIVHVFEDNSAVNLFMGLGFLMAGIFLLFYTFYYPVFIWFLPTYPDLFARYWILARFAELLLYLTAISPIQLKINKYLATLLVCGISIGISVFILLNPYHSLLLVTETFHSTTFNMVLQVSVAVLYLGCFALLLKNKSKVNHPSQYFLLSLLLSITTQLCSLYNGPWNSFFLVMGHSLKTFSYGCLFVGIFYSCIIYPYRNLKESQRVMNSVFNAFPAGIITYDCHSNPIFINLRAKEILATENGPIVYPKMNWQAGKNFLSNYTNSAGENYILKYDFYNLGPDGYMHVFEDIKREQELEDLQVQTKTLINCIGEIVAVLNNQMEIILCNNFLLSTLGVEERAVKGKRIQEVLSMISYTKVKGNPMPESDLNSNFEFEGWITNVQGEAKLISGSYSLIYNVEHEKIGSILVAADITHKEREKEMIFQQEKLAVLGQMAAGIVHEIKNPLTTIKGFNQIILEKTKENTIRNYAEVIEEEVNIINQVVSDFLAYARPRKPVLKEISLSSLVKSIQTMIETQLYVQGIDFELFLPSSEQRVYVDENQIIQVLLNIIKNAIEALDQVEKPKISVVLGLMEDCGEMEIQISDNGKGIPPQDWDKIGNPFFTTKDKGTGLGLSICYQIVQENKGRIYFESDPARGTTFHIILPCIPSEQKLPAASA